MLRNTPFHASQLKDGFLGLLLMHGAPSPSNPSHAGDLIEVGIVTQDGKSILSGECCDPQIVFGNGLAGNAKLMSDFGVNAARFGGDIENGAVGLQFIQPFLAHGALARRFEAIPVFAQDYDWQRDRRGKFLNALEEAGARIGKRGDGVGVEDHFQSSGSIRSNSSSMSF